MPVSTGRDSSRDAERGDAADRLEQRFAVDAERRDRLDVGQPREVFDVVRVEPSSCTTRSRRDDASSR
jgi:hypothetical protein